MRKLELLFFLLTGFLTGGESLHAQDPHFSQAHRIPAWYNPAAAGHGVEHIRLTMLYRNQWSSVTSPFKTEGLFFDKQVSRVGFGINLVNNSSGDAGIRQLFLNGQLSYRYSFGKNSFAGGVQLGLIQKSFDPSKMTFDDQYTPDQGFNPSNPTAETFSYTKLTRPDVGAGILWSYGEAGKDQLLPFAGVSLQHINQPKESFILDNNAIPRKLSTQAGVGIHLKESLVITPMVMYTSQQSAKELLGAVMVKIPLEGRDHVEGGIIYRNKDAVALYAGYQWNSFMTGISYDANISGLTGGPGAFELTLTYIPKAKIKKDPAKKKEKDKKPAAPAAKKKSSTSAVPVTTAKPKTSVPVSESKLSTTAPAGLSTPTTVKEKPAATSSATKKVPATTPAPATKPTSPPAPPKEKVMPPAEIIKATPAALPAALKVTVPVLQPMKKSGTAPTGLPLNIPEPQLITQAVPKVAPSHLKVEPIVLLPAKKTVAAPAGLPSNVPEQELILQAVPKALPSRIKAGNPDLQPTGRAIPVNAGLPVNTPEPEAAPLAANEPLQKKEPDADNDGVDDSKDPCPYIKGSIASGGCPDTDGDGILDMNDPCPLEAGTKESNGCAAKGKPEDSGAQITQHFGNIEFKTSSAEVHGLYKLDIIEPALDSLYAHEDLILIITGHTDSEGDAPFNMVLSQERTDVVKAIFLRKGLPESRITTVAYGETMPLQENVSESGRQHNRRVEIHVIKKINP